MTWLIPKKYYAMALVMHGFAYAFTPPLTVMDRIDAGFLGAFALLLGVGIVWTHDRT